MKCVICGKNFEQENCPICGFTKFIIPSGVELEKVIEENKETIDLFRTDFLSNLEISVEIFRWKNKNGTLTENGKDLVRIGSGNELMEKKVWAEQEFARIENVDTINVNLLVKYKRGENTISVEVPNLKQSELQRIGAELNQKMEIKLFLGNRIEEKESSFIPLFE